MIFHELLQCGKSDFIDFFLTDLLVYDIEQRILKAFRNVAFIRGSSHELLHGFALETSVDFPVLNSVVQGVLQRGFREYLHEVLTT